MFSGAYKEIKKSLDQAKKEQYDSLHQGNFKLLKEYIFNAGEFGSYPVTELVDKPGANRKVIEIANLYHSHENEFPYIFVIGHSSQLDALNRDKDYSRLEVNWEFAGRRAAKIAYLLQEQLKGIQKDRIIVMTAGEFDMKNPSAPLSQENAFVEIVFGKDWKIPSVSYNSSMPSS